MTTLFDPARHEPLTATAWSHAVADAAIRRIAADAVRAFDGSARLWPAHPLDEPEPPSSRNAMLYFGAGGVIWGLSRLHELGAIDGVVLPDFAPAVATLSARNRETLRRWGYGDDMTRSYFMGDAGLHLLQWRRSGDARIADALYDVVAANVDHPALEPLWGSPGTVLAALHMAEAGQGPRWPALFAAALQRLWQQMQRDPGIGTWIWQQRLYGKSVRYLGAAHGFVGNVYPALRGAAWLDAALVDGFVQRALETLLATALRDGPFVNWHAVVDARRIGGRPPLVQDCHGAPGIVCRLASAPRSAAWDELLNGAGELTWHAGPLIKGAGLCHGTAGNGYALLKLHERTGEARWLEHARAFAMHAIEQVERHRTQYGAGRWSLWTGDIGVALYLHDCIEGQARLPTLDSF
jgi:hypothetical protein